MNTCLLINSFIILWALFISLKNLFMNFIHELYHYFNHQFIYQLQQYSNSVHFNLFQYSALFDSFMFSLCYVSSVYLLLHYDDICSLILEYIIEDYFVRTIHSNMIWYDMIWYDMINAITCDIVMFVIAPLIGTIWCGTDIW